MANKLFMVAALMASMPRPRFLALAESKKPSRPAPLAKKDWYRVENRASDGPAEILIYDRIGKDYWSNEGIESKAFVQDLSAIPRDRDITLRINSPGGNVHDGLVIYNRLKERREHVTVIVDGVAASIASVIALAGHKLVMPENAMLMIHDPYGICEGNAAAMRSAAEKLDAHRDSIMSVYREKTGMDDEDIKSAMAAETWYTGSEAVDAGFADEATEEISFQACFDWTPFSHVPERLKEQQPQNRKEQSKMNKNQVMAKLRKLGIAFNEADSVEALMALLPKSEKQADKPKARGTTPKNFKAAEGDEVEGSDGEDEGDETQNADEGEGSNDDAEGDDAPEPATPQAGARRGMRPAQAAATGRRNVAPVISVEAFNKLQAQNDAIQARLEKERKQNIERQVDTCIAEDRIPAAQRGKWVTRALADEDVLNDLRAMEPRPPGTAPVGVSISSESPQAVERGILDLRKPVQSWLRGNTIKPEVIANHSKAIYAAIGKHRKQIDAVLNTNTVDSDLKRNVILSDLMRDFERRLLMLNIFATTFTNVPLEGTNKVLVPFFELDTATSKDYDATVGYVFDQDTDVGKREVTINRRKYKPMEFSSDEFRRQPYFNPPVSLLLKAEQLALDVWTDILSVITVANYGAAGLDEEPGSFDSDSILQLKKVARRRDWPDLGRALALTEDHEEAVLRDDDLKNYDKSGDTRPLREGSAGRLAGFDTYWSPRIPTNSENLVGFACLPQAVIVATAPIMPAPGVRQQLLNYDLVVSPSTGIAFEYRYGADVWKDKDREVVECNYGFGKGKASCLIRVTDGAVEGSSSSSASSESSSSSSESSASSDSTASSANSSSSTGV